MTAWVARYVGLPRVELGRDRDGVDCFGLHRLILRDECGIDIPSYTGAYACAAERAELAALIAGGAQVGPWRQVAAGDIRPFDGLLFRMLGHASHIGTAIDGRRMVHVHSDVSKVVRLGDPAWASRLVGVWRHEELMT